MTQTFKNVWLSICCGLLLGLAIPVFAKDTSAKNDVAETTDSVEQVVQAETDKQAAQRRKAILQEAVDALAQTKEALTALEEERVDDALEALAVTTGKLELIVAREPTLALAPTDVSISTHDLYATKDAVQSAIDRAEDAIEDGDVQTARRILNGLGSEMVISVTNLPLATYPAAIKAISPLIDDGEIEEAKSSLQAALNTVVVIDHVVPLPVLRSDALLERAEELAENPERTEAENEELANHLAAVRNQLEMAQVLGYGDRSDYKPLYAQLEEIEKQTKDGRSEQGLFDQIKASMTDLWESIFS